MPIYDYICPQCGLRENVWAKIEEQVHCQCGLLMTRVLSAVRLNLDIPTMGQFEPNIAHPDKAPHGTMIESKQQRDRLCREYGIHITK